MDDRSTESAAPPAPATDFVQSLREQRGRVRQFVAAHRARLDHVESQLAEQLERIQHDLDHERRKTGSVRDQIAIQNEHLTQQHAQLDARELELQEREQEYIQARELFESEQQSRRETLTRTEASVVGAELALKTATAEVEQQRALVAKLEQELSNRGAQLAAREKELAESEQKLTAGRQQLATAEQAVATQQVEFSQRQRELEQRADDAAELEAALAARQSQLAQERARLEQELDAERVAVERCRQFELQLADAESKLAQQQSQAQELAAALNQAETEKAAALADQFATLETLKADYEEQLARSAASLNTAEFAREQLAAELEGAQAELALTRQQAAAVQQKLDDQLAAQSTVNERIHTLDVELAQLRAAALQDQRQQAELQAAAVEREAALQSELEQSFSELQAASVALAQSETVLEEHRSALTEALEQLRVLQSESLARSLEKTAGAAADEEIARLNKERQLLLARLAEADARVAEAESRAAAAPDTTAAETRATDFERRYQMALDDLREQKARNADLQRKLSQAPAAAATAAARDTSGAMDWESQKRRLLASLEDSGADESVPVQDRLRVEDAIRATDEAVAEKEREIRELRQMLADQVDTPANAETDAAMVAALDKDLGIQQERMKLEKLQAEWQEKLREAEVEVSVERAKIARERAQLDEKLRVLQQEQAQHLQDGGSPNDPGPRKPTRGKWMTRLGLNGAGDE